MDWFERLTGFPETDYDRTRANLTVGGAQLRSLANGASFGFGCINLRQRSAPGLPRSGGEGRKPPFSASAGSLGEQRDRVNLEALPQKG